MNIEGLEPNEDGMKTVLRVIPMPADIGVGHRIATGWLLAKLDQGAAVLPSGHFGRHAVLVSCDALAVKMPVQLGDCVTIRAAIEQSDATSVVVNAQVLAERRGENKPFLVMTTRMRYEAVDAAEDNLLFSQMFAVWNDTR